MLKLTLLVLMFACLSSAAYNNWYWNPVGRSATGTTSYSQPTAAVTATQSSGSHGYVVTQQHPAYVYPRPLTTGYAYSPHTAQYTAPGYPTYYHNVHPQYYYPGWGYTINSY
ncbi:hypothetical protein CHUAL_003906 [Chamberlinius hualienensis]